MKVTAILKKGTVTIRTTTGKVRKFKATKMRATPQEWDSKAGRCKSNHPSSTHFNIAIKKLIAEATLAGAAPAPEFADGYLFKYALASIDAWERTKASTTLREYRASVRKLQGYTADRKLSTVNIDFLQGYQDYCFNEGNAHGTVWNAFKFLKLIMKKAHKERLIQYNPFAQFSAVKYKNPERPFLEQEDVARVEAYSTGDRGTESLRFAARWFVIGCHTGLRYGDMNKFNKLEHIRNGRLMLYTSKTGELVSIPFKHRLVELFARVQYKPLHQLNENYNRYLKQVQQACGIHTTLSSHVARHTFGVYCADQGLSIEVTAKLLGQKDLKVTAIYYKISNKRLDKEVDLLF